MISEKILLQTLKKKSETNEAGIIRDDHFIEYYNEYLSGSKRISDFFDISRIYITEKWMRNYFS